ncbi:MAG TPA: glycosyltransferase family 4 protein [Bryobacteraceae bacterium]|jgi:glycosyltransferase involved in cell wall biosynthesis
MRLLAVLEAESVSGPAKNLLEFARLARPLGIETSIAIIARREPATSLVEMVRDCRVSLELVKERRPFDPKVIAALRDVARRARPDLIQTHAVKSHFLARWARLPRIAPWIAFHHGYTRPAARVVLYNQLDRWSLRAARKVVTMSVPFREELARRGVSRERIEIVHNAIAENWGAAACGDPEGMRARLGIPPGRPVVLSVGRLSREKDHLTLLEAMRLLPSALDAHLIVLGDGPERPRIERSIARLGLRDRVSLTGHQPSAAPYYAIANAAVLSSRSEGSPNALLEAMACGVPVVATNVGGIPEHVESGCSALLVAAGNPTEMSAAIASLIGVDRELARRLADRSKELIRERHSPEARAGKLAAIYASVLAGV